MGIKVPVFKNLTAVLEHKKHVNHGFVKIFKSHLNRKDSGGGKRQF